MSAGTESRVCSARFRLADGCPDVLDLDSRERKRILVAGGGGFVGSHLVDRLMIQGHEVIVVDNYITGQKKNLSHWAGHKNFQLMCHDIVHPLSIEVNEIYHLASPASPPHYMRNPVKTIEANTVGTINLLKLAQKNQAKLLLASTSEVYGDPEVHPQPESYWGHVNPIGPRSCYDEGKRLAEALCYAFWRQEGVSVAVARIFNTYGPRMDVHDGRVVSNFITQALQNKPITVYGSGEQTRSFQYVSDLVDGMTSLMAADYCFPVNIGNPEEFTVNELAEFIKGMVGGTSSILHEPSAVDDPRRRKPDISVAKEVLRWQPKVPLKDGIGQTVQYFKEELDYKC